MGIFSRRKAAQPRHARRRIDVRSAFLPHFIRGDYTLQNSELLFSAVSRISNALSVMPVQLYKGAALVNNELNDLVKNAPNTIMTSSNFFKTMEACRCAYGNCYALKIVDANMKVLRLDVLDPSRVTPVLNDETGELWYRVLPERGQEFYIDAYYMIHIPFISTNGYIGVNPVSVLFDTLSYSEDIQKFSKAQLDKGLNAAVVLEAPANIGKSQQEKMVKDFMEVYKETGGNILMLESGVTAKALNLSPVDTKLFEVEKITRSSVAMVYNLPPHLLGDYADTSFNSQEQQMLEFLMLTMLPIKTAYEQELTKKLLTPTERKNKMHFRMDMDVIIRADAATMATVNQKAVRSGYKSPNDIRAEKGEPRIKGGDEYWVSRDMVPMLWAMQHPEKSSATGGGVASKEPPAPDNSGGKENEQDSKDDGDQQGSS